MRDIVLELRTPEAEIAAVPPKAVRWPSAAAAAAIVLAFAAGWVLSRSWQAPELAQVYRAQLNPPEGGQFDIARGFALSPEGRWLAFVANAPGKSGLWIRPPDGSVARLLPGTERATVSSWSPDSRSLVYGHSGKLWRVDVIGGTPTAICDAVAIGGVAWTLEGNLVFSAGVGGLLRVPVTGGTPTPLTTVDAARGEVGHVLPVLLPGGRILFQVLGTPLVRGLYVTSLSNPRERVRVVANEGAGGVYADGYLLWLRGSTLLAQRFDPERLQLSGDPRPIADPVGIGAGRMAVTASPRRLLVYSRVLGSQLRWVDRAGKPSGSDGGTFGAPGAYFIFRISPDGRRVVLSRVLPDGMNLWMVDLDRNVWSQFTFVEGSASYPVWSPDGRQVMFIAGSPANLYRKEATGAGTEQRVTESANPQSPSDWSRNGRLVLYSELAPDTRSDLWVLPVTPDGKPVGAARLYLRTPYNERDGRFSPEPSPRWVAYTSDESGLDEIYVRAFPDPQGKFQISTGGGRYAEWSPDGRELYYEAQGKLMAVALRLGTDFVVSSTPRELFTLATLTSRPAAVAPDGKRFLVEVPMGGPQPLEVVVNWPALLKMGMSGE